MKRICAIILSCLILVSSLTALHVNAASEFEIRSGVLVKYNGSASSVTVPSGVVEIGAEAFLGQTGMTSVALPSSVCSVGERAFYGCTSLKTVTGGNNVAQVGDYAFFRTPYIDNSTDKYFMLGHVLLWYNGDSQSVSIPTHCTAVASNAFMKCTYLKSFTAYDGLISIGSGAFYGCSALSSMNMPSTLSSVGAYAFDGVPYIANLGDFAVIGDGVLVRYQGTSAQVAVPTSVKRIAPRAFTSSKITSVSVPESVYAIDDYAFADCTGISELELSEGLMSIGNRSFSGCKSLTNVMTPTTLTYLGQSAFHGDASLSAVSVRGNSLHIADNAFKGCTSLQYALLSDGVSSVYANAFDGCSALSGVSFPNSVNSIDTSALSGCNKVNVCCTDNAKAKTALSSHAVYTKIGDTDLDGKMAILDATVIQRYLTHMQTLTGKSVALSDVNSDAEVNILDALTIQMKLANFA